MKPFLIFLLSFASISAFGAFKPKRFNLNAELIMNYDQENEYTVYSIKNRTLSLERDDFGWNSVSMKLKNNYLFHAELYNFSDEGFFRLDLIIYYLTKIDESTTKRTPICTIKVQEEGLEDFEKFKRLPMSEYCYQLNPKQEISLEVQLID